jgi:iron(III) transport system permease protein
VSVIAETGPPSADVAVTDGLAGGTDRGWLVVLVVIAGLALAPLLALAAIAFAPTGGVWQHLIDTVLPRAVETTFLLMLGVGLLAGTIGVGTAWLVVMYRFPGRAVFEWALLLPLAIPTYIAAYAAVEVADFTGPLQTAIRFLFGYTLKREYWFPEIRSLGGAVIVMGLVLYPYVYLTARAAFLMQSACALDVARTLGAGPWRVFFRVALPLARPAIVVGVSLALMECLNDIGAVQFFGVKTLTFSIYDIWLNRGSLAGAAQVSCAMLVVVVALLMVERRARRDRRFVQTTTRLSPLARRRLAPGRGVLAALLCALPVVIGFAVPAGVLLDSALRRLDQAADPAFRAAAANSLILALAAVVVTVAAGTLVAYALRVRADRPARLAATVASIGYAVPGTVLAVGILVPLARIDNLLADGARALFGVSTGLILGGSGVGLVYAYASRFLTIPLGTVETGLAKLSVHLDMAARTLGRNATATLAEIHLPLLKPALLTSALIVFVDTMKELPATVLLRPFNFETLATTVFAAASREHFEESALAALAIVAVGLLPVILIARASGSGFRDRG